MAPRHPNDDPNRPRYTPPAEDTISYEHESDYTASDLPDRDFGFPFHFIVDDDPPEEWDEP